MQFMLRCDFILDHCNNFRLWSYMPTVLFLAITFLLQTKRWLVYILKFNWFNFTDIIFWILLRNAATFNLIVQNVFLTIVLILIFFLCSIVNHHILIPLLKVLSFRVVLFFFNYFIDVFLVRFNVFIVWLWDNWLLRSGLWLHPILTDYIHKVWIVDIRWLSSFETA